MSKLLRFFSLFFIGILTANAQLVEHYENPQRFQIPQFTNHNNMMFLGGFLIPEFYPNLYFSQKFNKSEDHRFVYGVALPLNTNNLRFSPVGRGNIATPAERWRRTL